MRRRPMALTRAVLEDRFALTHLAFLLLLWEHLWGCTSCGIWPGWLWAERGLQGPPTCGAIAQRGLPTAVGGVYAVVCCGRWEAAGSAVWATSGAPVPHQAPPGSAQARPWPPPQAGGGMREQKDPCPFLPGRGDSLGL